MKIKILLFALLLALTIQSIKATDRVWIENFVIKPGETKTIELLLDNEVVYKSLQCDFDLPQGLSIVKNSSNQPAFSGTERTATHIIRGSQPAGTGENHYRVGFITLANPIAAGSGAIATFQVTASEDFHGKNEILLSGIRVGDINNVSYGLDDFTCYVTTPMTLADIIEEGEEGLRYSVNESLTCVYVTADGKTLYAKDDNAFAMKDVWPYQPSESQIDNNKIFDAPGDFDQSNWVAINLPEALSSNQLSEYIGHKISGITGLLKSRLNPEIDADAVPEAGEENKYIPNLYTIASFAESNTYFAMPAKPQEYVYIHWAVYKDGNFYMPKSENGVNTEHLNGVVTARLDLYEGEPFDNNVMYELKGIVKALKPRSSAYGASLKYEPVPVNVQEGEPSTYYEFYPIESSTNDYVTGISSVNVGNEDGTYYNLLGQPVINPTPGIYIKNGKKVIVK
ncbi:MAG: hypothetical protein IJR20_09510 [Muribaculaceae bacterium]|nr:hypothetical protein [Muribaculaceae bacterium]